MSEEQKEGLEGEPLDPRDPTEQRRYEIVQGVMYHDGIKTDKDLKEKAEQYGYSTHSQALIEDQKLFTSLGLPIERRRGRFVYKGFNPALWNYRSSQNTAEKADISCLVSALLLGEYGHSPFEPNPMEQLMGQLKEVNDANAQRVMALIEGYQKKIYLRSIGMDSGTTTHNIAEYMRYVEAAYGGELPFKEMRVISNSAKLLDSILDLPRFKMIALGGRYLPAATTVGNNLFEGWQRWQLTLDACIVGFTRIMPYNPIPEYSNQKRLGLFSFSYDESAAKRTLLESSMLRIGVGVSSKITGELWNHENPQIEAKDPYASFTGTGILFEMLNWEDLSEQLVNKGQAGEQLRHILGLGLEESEAFRRNIHELNDVVSNQYDMDMRRQILDSLNVFVAPGLEENWQRIKDILGRSFTSRDHVVSRPMVDLLITDKGLADEKAALLWEYGLPVVRVDGEKNPSLRKRTSVKGENTVAVRRDMQVERKADIGHMCCTLMLGLQRKMPHVRFTLSDIFRQLDPDELTAHHAQVAKNIREKINQYLDKPRPSVCLDAGSTIEAIGKALARVKQYGPDPYSSIAHLNILTNYNRLLEELSPRESPQSPRFINLNLKLLGGEISPHTEAIMGVLSKECWEAWKIPDPDLAIVGTTSILTASAFMPSERPRLLSLTCDSKEEAVLKRQFLESARLLRCVCADSSKLITPGRNAMATFVDIASESHMVDLLITDEGPEDKEQKNSYEETVEALWEHGIAVLKTGFRSVRR